MNQQPLGLKAAAVDQALLSTEQGGLNEFLRRTANRQLLDEGVPAWQYDFYATRTKRQGEGGAEVFGPHTLHLGSASEELLYGQHRSPFFRFREVAKRLVGRVQAWLKTEGDLLEWTHQSTLIWSEIGQLKDLLGEDDEMDNVLVELRTARHQFIGKDTSTEAARALGDIFTWIAQAPVLDLRLVDQIIDRLEGIGVDPFAQDLPDGGSGA